MEIIELGAIGYASNCYIIHSGADAYIVDPTAEVEKILSTLGERHLTLQGVLLTHGHFDHLLSLSPLLDAVRVPVYIHELDAELLGDAHKNASLPLLLRSLTFPAADRYLHDGDILPLGDESVTVLHTPGHTQGSVCFDLGEAMLTGDTLFSEGYGRVDLYGGDRGSLVHSMRRLCTLASDSDRRIFCGHGESSTLREALRITLSYL